MALICLTRVADIQVRRGQLRLATATCQEIRRLTTEQAGWSLIATGFADVISGTVLREWNELEAAEYHVRQGIARWQHAANPRYMLEGLIALARVLQAQEKFSDALASYQQATRIDQQHATPLTLNEPSTAAYLARCQLAQGT